MLTQEHLFSIIYTERTFSFTSNFFHMTDTLYEKRKTQLIKYYRKQKRLPTYTELANVFGINSKGSVHSYVEKFIEDGLMRKSEGGALIPTTKLYGIRVLGTIQAGFPTDADEVVDFVSLNDLLIHEPSATYLLTVNGDSMKDAGIVKGDMVIVNKNSTAKPGSMVVAEVDHEWTLKYFMKKGDKVFLRAANSKYPDIYPRQQLRVGGVVTGVVRKYI